MKTEGVTKSLAARDDFVLFLFTLMTNKKTFLQTATLIEDILGVKKVGVVFTISLKSCNQPVMIRKVKLR